MVKSKLYYNNEGYADPTAGTALSACEKEQSEKEKAIEDKKHRLIKVLKFISAESGFDLIGRIQLKHKESGKEYR
jgi:hypothetical protein